MPIETLTPERFRVTVSAASIDAKRLEGDKQIVLLVAQQSYAPPVTVVLSHEDAYTLAQWLVGFVGEKGQG